MQEEEGNTFVSLSQELKVLKVNTWKSATAKNKFPTHPSTLSFEVFSF